MFDAIGIIGSRDVLASKTLNHDHRVARTGEATGAESTTNSSQCTMLWLETASTVGTICGRNMFVLCFAIAPTLECTPCTMQMAATKLG